MSGNDSVDINKQNATSKKQIPQLSEINSNNQSQILSGQKSTKNQNEKILQIYSFKSNVGVSPKNQYHNHTSRSNSSFKSQGTTTGAALATHSNIDLNSSQNPNSLLQAKWIRQTVEREEKLITNRVMMLQNEEKKLMKKIQDTRQRAEKMLEIKQQNEQEYIERMQQKLQREQEIEVEREKFNQLKNQSQQVKHLRTQSLFNQKRNDYIEIKNQREQIKQETQEISQLKTQINQEKRERVQKSLIDARKKLEEMKVQKELQRKEFYQIRVDKQANVINEKSDKIKKMEELETQLLNRLKNSQIAQNEAIEKLKSSFSYTQQKIKDRVQVGDIRKPEIDSVKKFGYQTPKDSSQFGDNENDTQGQSNQKENDDKTDQSFISPLMNQTSQVAESRFTSEEISKIKKEFDKLSKDQVIGKRKLLEYFKLMEINDTYLTNELFFMIKNSSSLNSPVDYNKFINFVSLISKGTKQEKLQLLFSFFDKTPDAKISKEELKAHISGTILSLANITFDDGGVENLKQSICRAQEAQIDAALDLFVEEIFSKHSSNQDELTYEEWSSWFLSLEGMKEVLEMRPNRIQKNISQNHGKNSHSIGGVNGRRDKGYLEKTSSLNSSKNFIHKQSS
eukprot:403357915